MDPSKKKYKLVRSKFDKFVVERLFSERRMKRGRGPKDVIEFFLLHPILKEITRYEIITSLYESYLTFILLVFIETVLVCVCFLWFSNFVIEFI